MDKGYGSQENDGLKSSLNKVSMTKLQSSGNRLCKPVTDSCKLPASGGCV